MVVLDGDLDGLKNALREANLLVVNGPALLPNEGQRELLLCHRLLVTRRPVSFMGDAPVYEYGIVSVKGLRFIDSNPIYGKNKTAKLISTALSRHRLGTKGCPVPAGVKRRREAPPANPGLRHMIYYLIGDATAPVAVGSKIICHVCNDIGAWGKGFVLAISKRWPEPEAAYREWHRNRENNDFKLGAVQLVQVQPDLWVANTIGQHGLQRQSGQPPIR